MSGLSFKVVIPARYASTRLPAKPLLDLGGKPMVVRVAERARLAGAEEVWVATDHRDVWAAAEAHEVAALAVYLASPQAFMITGQDIAIDGHVETFHIK